MIAALRRFHPTHRLAIPIRTPPPAATERAFGQLPRLSARRITLAAAAAIALTPAAAQRVPSADNTTYARAIAAGYKAAMYCSGIFTAGRTPAQIDADELTGIYPEYNAIVPTLQVEVNRTDYVVTVAYDPAMPPRRSVWRWYSGCTTEPIGATAPEVFVPSERKPVPAPDTRPWPLGDAGVAPSPAPALAGAVARAFAGGYGSGAKTIGVVVLRDGKVVAERYGDGWGPFTSNRTWSVAKSIAGTWVGYVRQIAPTQAPPMDERHLIIFPTPNDPRGAITLDNLLRMASGLHSDTAGNRTDAIYFGGTAVDDQATGWPLEAKPGTRFRYANNDILLAVLELRHFRVADNRSLAGRLFLPLGMTHTVAETDWKGNYILSSQVWSTARDLARLGQFWLQDGVWQGKRLLPEGWVKYMTTPSGPQPTDGPGYGATLWLFGPKQGLPAGSYAAQGNRGQYVMVVPSERLVVVRRGEDPGAARFDIARFTADIIAAGR